MALLHDFLGMLKRRKAKKGLSDAYDSLNQISERLSQQLSILREEHKRLVEQNIAIKGNKDTTTGALGLSKTEMIEETLIPQLKQLSERTEEKFLEVEEDIEAVMPVEDAERFEYDMMIEFLNNIEAFCISLEKIHKMNPKDRMIAIEESLREIKALSKTFHDRIEKGKTAAKKPEPSAYKRIVKVFDEAKKENHFTVWITKKQISGLFKEALKINRSDDPAWKINFRKWWQYPPEPEYDYAPVCDGLETNSPDKNPHINVTMKINGKKKDIHLCVGDLERKAA